MPSRWRSPLVELVGEFSVGEHVDAVLVHRLHDHRERLHLRELTLRLLERVEQRHRVAPEVALEIRRLDARVAAVVCPVGPRHLLRALRRGEQIRVRLADVLARLLSDRGHQITTSRSTSS
jgi:hypothetical protein